MSSGGYKDVMKNGWHPKGKTGGKESWRGDFKGINQVAGWMGKGKDPNEEAREHMSAPLSSLKDPNSFAPPPKHINYHGAAAAPDRITPDRGGWGAPLPQREIEEQKAEARKEEEEANKPKPPPVPYRVNTTGLKTEHLPPPPRRTDGADNRTPSPNAAPRPNLPPRLPPRQNSAASLTTSTTAGPPPAYSEQSIEPPAHQGILNAGSVSRLGAAGVSVPGLGIGNKPPLLPSRSSSTTSPGAPTASWQKGVSQLSDRTQQLNLASHSPGPEVSSEGTSFAQKQAAIKTAAAFKQDPSSVSLSDARSAASTANNFRQRHGEQISAGLKSANALNSKYGITDASNLSAASSTPPASASTDTPSKLSAAYFGEHTTAFKKKPPPPPPKKKPGLVGKSNVAPNDAPDAPPIPYSSKPSPPPSHSGQPDLDLDLQSLWFAHDPPRFPPPSLKRNPDLQNFKMSYCYTTNGVRKKYTVNAALRHMSTLAITKIRVTWDSANPSLTVRGEQQHLPPPKPLSPMELDDFRHKYSRQVVRWCQDQIGQQVGNGECWTLANEALKAVAEGCRQRGVEPCLTSQSYTHGALLYHLNPSHVNPSGGVRAARVAAGDIIQFTRCHFQSRDGRSWSTAGDPDHTSVVTEVDDNGRVKVLEQNVGGVKRVQQGKYDFSTMTKGDVKIYRAVSMAWAGELTTVWTISKHRSMDTRQKQSPSRLLHRSSSSPASSARSTQSGEAAAQRARVEHKASPPSPQRSRFLSPLAASAAQTNDEAFFEGMMLVPLAVMDSNGEPQFELSRPPMNGDSIGIQVGPEGRPYTLRRDFIRSFSPKLWKMLEERWPAGKGYGSPHEESWIHILDVAPEPLDILMNWHQACLAARCEALRDVVKDLKSTSSTLKLSKPKEKANAADNFRIPESGKESITARIDNYIGVLHLAHSLEILDRAEGFIFGGLAEILQRLQGGHHHVTAAQVRAVCAVLPPRHRLRRLFVKAVATTALASGEYKFWEVERDVAGFGQELLDALRDRVHFAIGRSPLNSTWQWDFLNGTSEVSNASGTQTKETSPEKAMG